MRACSFIHPSKRTVRVRPNDYLAQSPPGVCGGPLARTVIQVNFFVALELGSLPTWGRRDFIRVLLCTAVIDVRASVNAELRELVLLDPQATERIGHRRHCTYPNSAVTRS